MEKDPSDMSFEELGSQLKLRADSHQHLAASAEFDLRQIRAQLEATEAQKAAAKAEQQARAARLLRFIFCRSPHGPEIAADRRLPGDGITIAAGIVAWRPTARRPMARQLLLNCRVLQFLSTAGNDGDRP